MKIKYFTSAGLAVIIAGVAVILFAVGGGTAKTRTGPAASARSVVSIRTTAVGRTLVDGRGRTLYLFEGDTRNVSRLSSAGLSVWPRFVVAGTVKAGNGVKAAKLGTTTSPKGVRQVTYNGHPLYYFVGDTKPGSVSGQGLLEFGALWYVLGPAGNAVTSAPHAAKSTPAPPSYGY